MAQTINQRIDALRALLKKRRHRRFHYPQYRPAPKRVRSTVLEIKRMDIGLHRFGRHGGDHQRQGGTVDRFPLFSPSRAAAGRQRHRLIQGNAARNAQHPRFPAGEPYSKFSCRYRRKGIFSTTQAIALQEDLAKNDITVKSIADPMNEIWTDRPPMPEAPAFIHEDEIRREKLSGQTGCYPPGDEKRVKRTYYWCRHWTR